MEVFDIRNCINELTMILADKASMKNIKLKTTLSYFEGNGDDRHEYYVKTDQKRLQQVLLNLLSNAIKFTRGGVIDIIIERMSKSQLRILVKD